MKSLFKPVLKLLGDRLLFIICTFIFMVPMTFLVKEPKHLLFYSIISAIPYLMLLYYDMWDAGHGQMEEGVKGISRSVYITLIWQIPTVVLLLVHVFTQNIVTKLIYEAYLAPLLAPRTMVYLEPMLSRDIAFYLIAPCIEIVFCIGAYLLGTKDYVLAKRFGIKKKK